MQKLTCGAGSVSVVLTAISIWHMSPPIAPVQDMIDAAVAELTMLDGSIAIHA